MPGNRKCEPWCTCRKHSRRTPEEQLQARREQTRESMKRWRERNPGAAAEVTRSRRQRDPEGLRAYERQYYAENRERINAYAAERYRRNPEPQKARSKEYQRKYGYSLTAQRFNEMLARQNGLCYLCGDPLSDDRYKITIDHDHSCCPGKKKSCGACVRGIACRQCNTGIGQFGDDPDRMRRAAAALEAANAHVRKKVEGT